MSDWPQLLKPFFETPKLGTTLVVLILVALFLAWLLYALFGDFNPRRRRIARRLLALASRFREAESGERQSDLSRLIGYVQSSDRFTSCYAAYVASRLAIEFPAQATGIIDALAALLENDDAFRRHAGAQALYHLGPAAETKRTAIQKAAEVLKEESAGTIAKRLIQHFNASPPWWPGKE